MVRQSLSGAGAIGAGAVGGVIGSASVSLNDLLQGYNIERTYDVTNAGGKRAGSISVKVRAPRCIPAQHVSVRLPGGGEPAEHSSSWLCCVHGVLSTTHSEV